MAKTRVTDASSSRSSLRHCLLVTRNVLISSVLSVGSVVSDLVERFEISIGLGAMGPLLLYSFYLRRPALAS
jgi:hypothetical protein